MKKINRLIYCNILLLSLFAISTELKAEMTPKRVENESKSLEATFYYPKHKNVRLDYCYNWAENCGKFVANEFCKIAGHDYSSGYIADINIGNNSKTYVLGDKATCSGEGCDSFSEIRCKNQ